MLLMEDDSVKIGDFGVSEVYNPDKKLENNKGTFHFMAPESFEEGFDGKIADIWALGVCLYCLAF